MTTPQITATDQLDALRKVCRQCGHKWLPRVERPKRCPNSRCTNPGRWDQPRVNESQVVAEERSEVRQ